ncbi:MAG TPA: hypothetical protein PKL08_01445, partial [Thermoanaerobaculaceae bacterium]|nr:hypothetical protein [Thermoanaerobaculaceae bacterium]
MRPPRTPLDVVAVSRCGFREHRSGATTAPSLETTLLSLLRWERERQWWLVAAALTLTMAAGLTFSAWPYAGFVMV